MKKFILSSIFLASGIGACFATQHTIGNVNTTFSPDSININTGDTVVFNLASFHNAVQVSYATWLTTDTTGLPGGFRLPKGGGMVAFPIPGKYYFICQPHATLHMRGVIIVETPLTVSNVTNEIALLNVFPNPASDFISVSYTLNSASNVNIRLINTAGAEVLNVLHESKDPGTYQETLSLNSNLPKGDYFVILNSNNQSNIQKVIVK